MKKAISSKRQVVLTFLTAPDDDLLTVDYYAKAIDDISKAPT